jgi:NAD(P)-dependent dehydrogenase (short-subunit alcohol dehydrogenase family)
VRALLGEGAAVVGLDLSPAVAGVAGGEAYHGVVADVCDPEAVGRALDEAAGRFGGLDMLVANAGVVPASAPVTGTDPDDWDRTMRVNLRANVTLLGAAHPLLAAAPRSGRLVVVGSKNVPAPGPGLAAYSASKAALTQLARVTALEWAADGIRVNVVHPDAVFDTGVWTPEVLEQRARRYGLTVEEYKRRNLLGVEITSDDVAALVATMLGPVFSRTTGAQVPIDGGNERVV